LSTGFDASAGWAEGGATLALAPDSLRESGAELQPARASTQALAATPIRVRLRTLRISSEVAVRPWCRTGPEFLLTACAPTGRLGIAARRQGAPDRHVPTHRVTYLTQPAL
jgi:hypothetical protein